MSEPKQEAPKYDSWCKCMDRLSYALFFFRTFEGRFGEPMEGCWLEQQKRVEALIDEYQVLRNKDCNEHSALAEEDWEFYGPDVANIEINPEWQKLIDIRSDEISARYEPLFKALLERIENETENLC